MGGGQLVASGALLVSPNAENDPGAVNVHGEAHDVDAGVLAGCYLPAGALQDSAGRTAEEEYHALVSTVHRYCFPTLWGSPRVLVQNCWGLYVLSFGNGLGSILQMLQFAAYRPQSFILGAHGGHGGRGLGLASLSDGQALHLSSGCVVLLSLACRSVCLV